MTVSDWESVIRENRAEHERLERLAARLTEADLARPLEAGWTVSGILAHLAFWDARAVRLLEKWKREGIGPSPADTDVINDAAKMLCLAVPPRAAADLAVRISLAINRLIESLSAETAGEIQARGTAVRLARFEHKRVHREEIERATGG